MTIEQNHVLGDFIAASNGPELVEAFGIRDEGNGRVRLRFTKEVLGIYKQPGDCIIISCARAQDGWPTSFEKKTPYIHIILHRVKPRK